MAVNSGREATAYARQLYRTRNSSYHLYCYRFVRECFGIGPRYYSANEGWEEAERRHRFTGVRNIPFGAPVWTDRAGGSEFGHIVLAGGKFPSNGKRIAWTTDQHGDGRITPVTFDFLTDVWGHKIKGWAKDLNGVDIPHLM